MAELHPLLQRATKYPRPNRDLTPTGCTYDSLAGAWVDDDSGVLLVDKIYRPGVLTKKADVETGEDQKGQ
jgi:hypothetical protein